MALINCPECNQEISNQAKSCPYCGYLINVRTIEWDIKKELSKKGNDSPKQNNKKGISWKSFWWLFFILIAVWIIILSIDSNKSINNLNNSSPKNYDTPIYKDKYSKANLNIRKRPEENSPVIRTLKPNDKVVTNGIVRNGFSQILKVGSQSVYGWCASRYLQDSPLSKTQINELEKKKANRKNNSVISNNGNQVQLSQYAPGSRYLVNEDFILATTSKANFDLIMNFIASGDTEAIQNFVFQGKATMLKRNTELILVKMTWSGYYVVRFPGSTFSMYVIGEQLKPK